MKIDSPDIWKGFITGVDEKERHNAFFSHASTYPRFRYSSNPIQSAEDMRTMYRFKYNRSPMRYMGNNTPYYE